MSDMPATTDVVVTRPYDAQELRSIKTMQDAIKLAHVRLNGREMPISTDVLGDGFELLKEKDRLIGINFVLLDWTWGEDSDLESKFVVARIVDANNHKFVITDGSTGIMAQIRGWETACNGERVPMAVVNGLRKSEYNYTDESGKTSKAVTYYLATN